MPIVNKCIGLEATLWGGGPLFGDFKAWSLHSELFPDALCCFQVSNKVETPLFLI